jgi:ferredoxin
MADKLNAWEDNQPGSWYVDESCIQCALCESAAPRNFSEAAAGDHYVLYKQPEGGEEEAQCLEAMAQCSVEAIGNDRE